MTRAILCALLVVGEALAADVSARGARIVEVTVYPDRAEVVREARFEVPSGGTTVEVPAIPLAIEPDSLRVSAKGVPATLGAVELRVRIEEPAETAAQAALREEVKRLETEIAKLGVADFVDNDMRLFLQSLRATAGAREAENLGAGRADPAAIQGVYDLLARELRELGEGELARRASRERFLRDLEVARGKLASARPRGDIQSRIAAIAIEAKQAGELTLRLSYVVAGASWRPSYRATLDAASGAVALVSEGVVRQATGEEWSDVALKLSTSSPARGVEPPQMASFFLRPMEVGAVGGRLDEADQRKDKARYQGLNVMAPAPKAAPADLPEESYDTDIAQAEIVRTAYNVAFEVPGRSTVPSDNADHRVVLRQELIPGTIDYRAIPAAQAAAFLTSVVKTPEQYPLLAGPMRVFAGATYLGAYALPEVAPGAEWAIPFGVDNRLRVERIRLPQERGTEGITGKTRQIEYAFRTRLENLRDLEVTITVEDRVPVSEDERIVVEIGKGTTPGRQESARRPGVFLWKITLAPREKKDLILEYGVRFPRELVVPGLE